MENELGLKPNQIRVMFTESFNTLEDLKIAIAKAELISNQIADVIHVEGGKFELEAECLSDGSVVYNVGLIS